MRFLLALFIIVPISEMWLLIQVGAQIGALYTVLLVFLTAAAGLALLRRQGLNTLMRLNQKIEQGQMPAGEIAEGVALAVGGALLLTPGFITDGIGFICLLPFTRKWFLGGLLGKIMPQAGFVHMQGHHNFGNNHSSNHSSNHGPNHAYNKSRNDSHIDSDASQSGDTGVRSGGDGEAPVTLDGEYRREP